MSPQNGARRRTTQIAVLTVFALTVLCGGARAAVETPGETFAVSAPPSGEPAAAGVGQRVAISADGRFVAFVSHSANLSPEATAWDQAYVKDLDTGALTLASRTGGAEGEPAAEPRGGGVERVFLSADGRYLAFETSAENLSAELPPAPPVAVTHVYRRDLETGDTEIVDRVDGAGGEVLPTEAHVLAISADGELVAFADRAEGLEGPTGAREGEETVYVRDLATGTTIRIAAEGAEKAAFSGDGRYLLFTSPAANLSPEANGEYQVYRRDLGSGETGLLSRGNPTGSAPQGEPADGEAFEASFAGPSDCRVVFLAAGTSDLTPGGDDPAEGIYVRDFCAATPSTTLVSVREDGEPFEEVFWPSAADQGQVVFEGENGFPEVRHLYLWEPATGQTTLLDRASGTGGEPADRAVVGGARIAAGGCRALFVSEADNLLGEEAPLPGEQAFVRQLTPCKQAPPPAAGPEPSSSGNERAGVPAPTSPSPDPTPALARTVAVTKLGRQALWLAFDGAGRARVRIQKLWPNGRGQWKLVRSFTVEASAAGVVRTALPRLASGRYRLELRLQGDPDNPTLTRRLGEVPASPVPCRRRSLRGRPAGTAAAGSGRRACTEP